MVISTAIAATALTAGVGASIAAGVKAKKTRKEIESQNSTINTQDEFNQELFDSEYYRNQADRADIQSALQDASDKFRANQERATAQAETTGATFDQKLAADENNRKMYSGAISGIAQNAGILRDAAKANWQNRHNQYFASWLGISDKIAGLYNNEASQLSTAGNNLFKTAANQFGTGKGK